jgi:hypothetical protein
MMKVRVRCAFVLREAGKPAARWITGSRTGKAAHWAGRYGPVMTK